MYCAAEGDTVKVNYTGTLADGTVFDSTEGRTPLHFIIGRQEVIAGFDRGVIGMVMGEKKTVVIPSDLGYGQKEENLIEEVDRKDLPEDLELKVGAQLEVTRQDGSKFLVMVAGVTDDTATLDANHPLAGRDLTFEVEMLEITKKEAK
ncbi:MAG: peptidylprolyl isomerase [Desulfuromonas sp.]|uniref:FKBP-type peptidyl-prolyl cis-trans isomerase n=1 Tax=Desulfuromonas sp. TaxID=892 RepID=UPI000CB69BA0|nr:FKBP-type peptidyl-prolyl cis-trans isomerase [Desulfuromonas sp.]PLX86140.1 MAG: peptidylprolyl isomerase [Desulfuromonas sp.]